MARPNLAKPDAFQEVFTRKPGTDNLNTHYCAGCGHGVVHKMIAEAISDLGIKDRVVICAPVGCSVFLYYYFDCCSVSVPHGRAPAALTGISRVHPEAINISYQGDGDLAAIGTAEIIHAANRGEKQAVFFVNNAIYGMTGGQMAPTTLEGMKTTTTPLGRDPFSEGHPMRMCEMISTLESPVYVERVALDSPKATMQTRKAIHKALKIQMEGKGFTMVEILSPCPTNWRLDPVKACDWVREKMYPVFPPGVYKDVSDETKPKIRDPKRVDGEALYGLMDISDELEGGDGPKSLPRGRLNFRLAGFGGQGVLLLGTLVAQAGMAEGYHVTWLPSYGPEMRGGTANSSVILSEEKIGSPVVEEMDVLMAMNAPSLHRFIEDVRADGVALYNSSIIEDPPSPPEGVRLLPVPAMDIAREVGEVRAANTVLLGAYAALSGLFSDAGLDRALQEGLKKKLVPINQKALKAGWEYVQNMEK